MKIELTINLAGDTRNARATLERFLEDALTFMRNQRAEAVAIPTPVSDLDISVRSVNALRSNDIKTVEELTKFSNNHLRRLPNIGSVTVREINYALKERGLSLAHYLYR